MLLTAAFAYNSKVYAGLKVSLIEITTGVALLIPNSIRDGYLRGGDKKGLTGLTLAEQATE